MCYQEIKFYLKIVWGHDNPPKLLSLGAKEGGSNSAHSKLNASISYGIPAGIRALTGGAVQPARTTSGPSTSLPQTLRSQAHGTSGPNHKNGSGLHKPLR